MHASSCLCPESISAIVVGLSQLNGSFKNKQFLNSFTGADGLQILCPAHAVFWYELKGFTCLGEERAKEKNAAKPVLGVEDM